MSRRIWLIPLVVQAPRASGTVFPLDDLILQGHVCRVIEAFVNRLDVGGLGFVRAGPTDTGRPGYDPRDLLKVYLYGYLQQIRSSRRLEAECQRNVEVMWLLGRLAPDHKSIAEFRRMIPVRREHGYIPRSGRAMARA